MNTIKILPVDDDPGQRSAYQHVLERLGHEVRLAEDGVQAARLLHDPAWAILAHSLVPTALQLLSARGPQPQHLRA